MVSDIPKSSNSTVSDLGKVKRNILMNLLKISSFQDEPLLRHEKFFERHLELQKSIKNTPAFEKRTQTVENIEKKCCNPRPKSGKMRGECFAHTLLASSLNEEVLQVDREVFEKFFPCH